MGMYVVVVGLVLIVAAVLLLRKRRTNRSVESPPTRKKQNNPQEPQKHKEYPVTIYKDGVPMKGWVKEMPQGLQCFDENGNIVVDVTDRLTKILGSFETHGRDGSITDDRLEGMDYWVALSCERVPSQINEWGWPRIARQGNRIVWDYSFSGNENGTCTNRKYLYGVI